MMSKPRVIIAGSIPVDRIPELRAVQSTFEEGFRTSLVPAEEPLLRETAARYQDAEVLVIPWTPHPLVTEPVLATLPELRLIISTYGGIKRNVAWRQAMDRGVRITCTGANRARSVAEFTLALMMDGLLHVSRIHHGMKSGERFPRYGYTRELTGRTVGLVGFGAVTRELLHLLGPFNVTPLVYSRHADRSELDRMKVESVSMDELAERSDIVVVLAGLTETTFHMIDGAVLAAMKDDALLVNTARGKLVDETALVAELRTGRIRAALDVYEEEPPSLDSPLRSLENVTLTAHSANSTREMDLGRWQFALEELRSFVEDGSLSGELEAAHIERMSDD